MKRAVLVAGLLVTLCGSAQAQTSDWPSLSAKLDLVSEDALTTAVSGDLPVTVGTADCDLDAADVPAFDAALVLDDTAQTNSMAAHGVYGFPALVNDTESTLFQNDYVITYSASLKLPIVAGYVLNSADIISRTREECFREDERLEVSARSTLSDYAEPVFDRGHLVPRADMNRTREAMINTFVLSNMMPQHDNFNQGVWETLESAVRAWTLSLGTVSVVTGAVFDKNSDGVKDVDSDADRVRPDLNVAIPTGFYKIVLHEQGTGFIDVIAVLMPHTDGDVPKSWEKEQKLAYIQDHIVSIDEIEAVTGLDFFAELSDVKETAIERSVAAGLWQ